MRKKIYIILLLLIGYTAYSQDLTIFGVDQSAFPTLRAKFYASDEYGVQIPDLLNSYFSVKEDGEFRTVTNVSCPEPLPQVQLSIVFAVDVTIFNNLNNAKSVLLAWLDMINLGHHEVALMSYDGRSYINQDYTIDKGKLTSAINSLQTLSSSEDHTGALIRPLTGAISVAKRAKYKPVVILLSSCSHFSGERTKEIIDEAKKNNTSINFVIFNVWDNTVEMCQLIADSTGGFSNNRIPYNDLVKAKSSLNNIFTKAEGGRLHCTLEWTSVASCVKASTNVEIKLIPNNLTSKSSYQMPDYALARLEIIPPSLKFKNAIPGIKKDTTITIYARNADHKISNITISNPAFKITPTSFSLSSGHSQILNVSYDVPNNSNPYCKFVIENNYCSTPYYAVGGFIKKKAEIETVLLNQPNGKEIFEVGNDTIITWDGVMPDEKVKLDYSTNNGTDWLPIADSATGLSYNWRVPKTPSNQCLARVTANLNYEYLGCDIGNVQIFDQIWMGCNLDVDHYRNGDSIPEVRDTAQWAKLTTGAWCYYNNDPMMGAIYGKLYNWYAVNDPRGLAPLGWHIPSETEWNKLSGYIGYDGGGKLKSTGNKVEGNGYWDFPNTGATNESGFTGLPGSYRYNTGTFDSLGYLGLWWTFGERDKVNGIVRYLYCNDDWFVQGSYNKEYGCSVRCIRD